MPTWEIRVGDARAELAKMETGSVQACVTSPPYFGLRSYSTVPQVWGGDGSCEHEWTERTERRSSGTGGNWQQAENGRQLAIGGPGSRFAGDLAAAREPTAIVTVAQATCTHCDAWRGELGAEPTVDVYVAHMVEVFHEVRRVLHSTGTLVLVLGDSYSGGGGYSPDAPSNQNGSIQSGQGGTKLFQSGNRRATQGFKAKDLLGVPWRVAFALQADGWTLRSAMPWLKRNCMPESVTDRPSSAVEYVFLLSKQKTYYWDAEAVKRGNDVHVRNGTVGGHKLTHMDGYNGIAGGPLKRDPTEPRGFARDITTVGRNYRNSDIFYDSIILTADDYALPEPQTTPQSTGPAFPSLGLILDEDGDPLALDVNPQPLAIAHFATFPPKLVEPLIKATTSERGACADCGSPWVRMVERTERPYVAPSTLDRYGTGEAGVHRNVGGQYTKWLNANPDRTTGWAKSCACATDKTRPCLVLDPFAGAGTTLMVALKLGRNAIGIELSPEYSALAAERIRDELGTLFITGGVVAPERGTA